MYLSLLTVDASHARGRTWLANPYRIHQRLCMAFPDGETGRMLFRVEADRQPPRIIVQSDGPADWQRAFSDHPVLLRPPAQKEVNLAFHAGQRLRFVLRANPTVRRAAKIDEVENGKRALGPRYGLLREEQQRDWLLRKGEAGGFRPLAFEVRSAGQISFARGDGRAKQTHVSVDFEGRLEVVDPLAFGATLRAGIGAAKAFGFGLLSVAPG